MRVLLVADDCNPRWPSLPVVGYHTCRTLADVVDAVVVTHLRNRPNVEAAGMGKARVVYVDNEYVAAPMHKLSQKLRGGENVGWTLNVALSYPSYLAFEWEVWKRFRGELRAGQFDVVHRVTPMSPTLPSPLARWSPAPFVLGPLNGGLRWPRAYYGERRREREWASGLRSAYRLLPYYRSTYARPAAILAAFRHTIDDLPKSARPRVIDFPEVGFDPATFHPPAVERRGESLTFLFAGRLVPYKCADVAVEAFARTPELAGHRLRIVGDGPERPALEQLIRDRGVGDRVEMLGAKTQAEVADLMRASDVFAFPSIRELGAGVVVEAMACGLPCVVVDYGGPGGLVRDGLGVRVPLMPKESLIEEFGRALAGVARDPARVRATGRAASEFASREYSWERKAEKIRDVYEWVLGARGEKPEFISSGPSPGDRGNESIAPAS